MVKNPSPRGPEPLSYWEVLKKINPLRPQEHSLGILGFLVVTVFCFLCCCFYLDYRVVSSGFRYRGQLQKLIWLGFDGPGESERVGFLEVGGEQCDLFNGEWVWDDRYPLYQSKDCRFIDDGFRCSENGRRDSFYTKWRWQPKDCNLPRFDAKEMLEKLRNRRLVFVGDSIGRNQWESLLCMLSSAIPNKDSIYEVNGSPITKHNGFLAFKFRDFNCTVEYYRSAFLVPQSRAPRGVPRKVKTTLKLDQMDWSSVRWKDADVLIFNSGHWWNYEKTIRGGCYFQEGNEVKLDMSVESAYQRSIMTLVDWIGREVNMSKTQIFFRTYAPVHFRGGNWRNGGTCHLETLPELGSSLLSSQSWPQFNIVGDILQSHSNKTQVMGLDVLNITHMTSRRKDAHSSLYYLGPKAIAPIHRQDCSHWCLPGVPDIWNELLYALFIKREVARTRNSTVSPQAQV